MSEIQHRFTFEINGRTYSGTIHPFDKALPIALRLGAMLSGPLLAAINEIKQDLYALSTVEGGVDNKDILFALTKVDLEGIGKPLSAALNDLAAKPELLNEIMANTFCGEDPLSNPANRNKVFTGRLFDVPKVVFEIVKANGWLPF